VAWRSTPEAVYLVGTAATPAGDDVVEVDVAAETGADLRIRSAAATVAWRSLGTVQRIRAHVADKARLDWHLEPLIATVGCCHCQHAVVDLRGSARLSWTEELLLGRCQEQPGRLDLRLDVDLDGRPLLRHQMSIGSGGAWDGPAILGSYRTLGLVMQAGPDYQPSPASGPGWARLPLDGPAALTVAIAGDLPQLRRALAAASDAA
jgi:urease accessory protein